MDILRPRKLEGLLHESKDICISIYLTTHPVGREQQQNPVRFKNLLSQTREGLMERGMRPPEIEALIAPADELLSDQYFWQHQSNGLVVFISTNISETYRLPVEFESLVVIADNFHIKPILPFVSGNKHFYLLALSQNKIRLLQGNRYHISEINPVNLPTSLSEALKFDDPEKQLQFHTGTRTPGTTNARPSIFHGHGVTKDDSKTDLLRFFQKVDRGMMEFLQHEQAPLVLASVDYLFPIYQKANSYSHIVNDVISGNPDERDNKELHEEAWKLVRPIFNHDLLEALERYQELSNSGSDLASNVLPEVVIASHHGQIEILFVTLNLQVWGRYHENQMVVEQHTEFQPGDQDLLDLAATQTLRNGGKVYALQPEQMPQPVIAAIYRFSYEN